MTLEEQHLEALSVRFVPYDCEGCFECFLKSTCIFAHPPQSQETIARCEQEQDALLDDDDLNDFQLHLDL